MNLNMNIGSWTAVEIVVKAWHSNKIYLYLKSKQANDPESMQIK